MPARAGALAQVDSLSDGSRVSGFELNVIFVTPDDLITRPGREPGDVGIAAAVGVGDDVAVQKGVAGQSDAVLVSVDGVRAKATGKREG